MYTPSCRYFALLIVCFALIAGAAEPTKPDATAVPPGKMLWNHLMVEAEKAFDARRLEVAALKTPADIEQRQKKLRARFIEAIGGFPERTPLNPQVVKTHQRDGYRVELVIYESRPQHHVTAALYLPEGQGPFPGVLMPCGHSGNGKADETNQRACILLAKNGIAAMCYDPIGQSERHQLIDEQGKPLIGNMTEEHTMLGIPALLVGRSLAGYRIWDGIRSLDYLASRPEIDPKKLGCTGCSGGGTLTSYLMALDDRILCAAPSCYITSLERLFATIGPQDAEQNITGQVAFGMEHADYVTMRAPRPTLILCNTRDFFDIFGTWTSFREAKQIYGLLGHAERVDLAEYNWTHGYIKPQRESMVRWMRRWLLDKDDAVVEGDFEILSDKELQCTRTGQVLLDFKGKSVADLNAERADELSKQRGEALTKMDREALVKEVRRLIGFSGLHDRHPAAPFFATFSNGRGADQSVGSFQPDAGIKLEASRSERAKQDGDEKKATPRTPLVIYLDGDGIAATQTGAESPVYKLAMAGHRVVQFQQRGQSSGTASSGKVSPFGAEANETWVSLHLNQPLLGQRVGDLLTIVDQLSKADKDPESHFEIVAVWSAGPVALHAALLDPRIERVTLQHSIISWTAVAKAPRSKNQFANTVPNALTVYDLPDLAAALAPRPLTIQAPVDAMDKPVDQATLDKEYASARAAYKKQGAEQSLVLEAAH